MKVVLYNHIVNQFLATCKEDFILEKGRCYRYFRQRTSQSQARKNCQRYGNEFDLLSINNWEEDDFIASLNNQKHWQAWIGLQKGSGENWDGGEGGTWTDGSLSPYRNWEGHEPNGDGEVGIM